MVFYSEHVGRSVIAFNKIHHASVEILQVAFIYAFYIHKLKQNLKPENQIYSFNTTVIVPDYRSLEKFEFILLINSVSQPDNKECLQNIFHILRVFDNNHLRDREKVPSLVL